MKGLKLSSLSGELHKVSVEHDKEPVKSIERLIEKLGTFPTEIRPYLTKDFDFFLDSHRVSLEKFVGFSFDELCKIHYSSRIMMSGSVTKFFERNVRHEIVRKIESSMWRWNMSRGTWNEVVETYNGIRGFKFSEDPDFEIRLDHTRGTNHFGCAKFSGVYLDGTFAFLVYYKRKHVMTIGFSVVDGKRILIQQIQSTQRTGNRYLYRLPSNRLEFVIDLFRKNFPEHALYLVDGNTLVDKILANYRESLEMAERGIKQYSSVPERLSNDNGFSQRMLEDYQKDHAAFVERIRHIEEDRERIASSYSNPGRYKFASVKFPAASLVHHLIREKKVAKPRAKPRILQRALELVS